MHAYGFDIKSLKFTDSYFNRKTKVDYGVAQGSILGPLLFNIIYIYIYNIYIFNIYIYNIYIYIYIYYIYILYDMICSLVLWWNQNRFCKLCWQNYTLLRSLNGESNQNTKRKMVKAISAVL